MADIHARANRLEGNKPRLVMLGSSSFRFWPSTDTVFSHFDVVNAGFGGSCFQDAWRLRDTLIYALDPDVLLIYEGDNDVHDRVPVDDVVGTASMLLDEVSLRMPNLEVAWPKNFGFQRVETALCLTPSGPWLTARSWWRIR